MGSRTPDGGPFSMSRFAIRSLILATISPLAFATPAFAQQPSPPQPTTPSAPPPDASTDAATAGETPD